MGKRQVGSTARRVRWSAEAVLWVLAALAAMAAAGVALSAPVSAQGAVGAPSCGGRVVQLSEGFNLVGVVDSRPASSYGVGTVFGWEPGSQQFLGWRDGTPTALNRLDRLIGGGGVWLEVARAGVQVSQAPGRGESREMMLEAGWNLVTWTGPDATPAGEAFAPGRFAGAEAPLVSAMGFDNVGKRFQTYAPRLPAALIDLERVDFGQAVWLQLRSPARWSIAGTGPCRVEPGSVAPAPETPAPETGAPETGAPADASPLPFAQSPVDLGLVTSVSPPGQLRGNDYKGHGLFRVASTETTVVMPAGAELYEGSRYIQSGEVQYLLYFRLPGGLVFIFDHVLEPSAPVLAAFTGAPAAKVDDSRTYGLTPTTLATGEVVATAVGFRGDGNAFVDFGVYDLSAPNAASQAGDFAGDRSTWRDAGALCWFGMFGAEAEASIRAVLGATSQEGTVSDLCD